MPEACPKISKIASYSNGATLYLGSIPKSYDYLFEKNINVIVTILSETIPQLDYRQTNIQHVYFPLDDVEYADIFQYFEYSSQFIFTSLLEGKNVLVHCYAGISRSASLIIAFFLYCLRFQPHMVTFSTFNDKLSWTDNVINHVRKQRNCIQPNPGFYRQLTQYEKQLKYRTY